MWDVGGAVYICEAVDVLHACLLLESTSPGSFHVNFPGLNSFTTRDIWCRNIHIYHISAHVN